MNTLLVIFTVVATISSGSASSVQYDWRPMGVFKSLASCEAARESLGDDAKKRTRCLQGAVGSIL